MLSSEASTGYPDKFGILYTKSTQVEAAELHEVHVREVGHATVGALLIVVLVPTVNDSKFLISKG